MFAVEKGESHVVTCVLAGTHMHLCSTVARSLCVCLAQVQRLLSQLMKCEPEGAARMTEISLQATALVRACAGGKALDKYLG